MLGEVLRRYPRSTLASPTTLEAAEGNWLLPHLRGIPDFEKPCASIEDLTFLATGKGHFG